MIKNDEISAAIDYILEHLEEEISIEAVAAHCHFSKFHFSRMFKAETGESIYAFIKRIKLEQSAINLKLEKGRSITEIGSEYGYSPSNYSTAFKGHHQASPVEFRKELNEIGVLHPFHKGERAKFQNFEEYDKRIHVEELEDFFVLYERYLGNYIDLAEHWNAFIEKHKLYMNEKTLLIERFYDDPSITGVNQCLCDICMTVDQDFVNGNTIIIPGGRFAIFRFEGAVEDIFTAFQGAFYTWLPYSGYEMDERYGLDIYRQMDYEKMQVIVDLCIPIK